MVWIGEQRVRMGKLLMTNDEKHDHYSRTGRGLFAGQKIMQDETRDEIIGVRGQDLDACNILYIYMKLFKTA